MKFDGKEAKIHVWTAEDRMYEYPVASIASMREKGNYSFGLSLKNSKEIDKLNVESANLLLDGEDQAPMRVYMGLGKSVDGRYTFIHFGRPARKATAMIHSLKAQAQVEIVSEKDNNNVVARYNGKHYTAIYNPFVSLYYVDDIYGEIQHG